MQPRPIASPAHASLVVLANLVPSRATSAALAALAGNYAVRLVYLATCAVLTSESPGRASVEPAYTGSNAVGA